MKMILQRINTAHKIHLAVVSLVSHNSHRYKALLRLILRTLPDISDATAIP